MGCDASWPWYVACLARLTGQAWPPPASHRRRMKAPSFRQDPEAGRSRARTAQSWYARTRLSKSGSRRSSGPWCTDRAPESPAGGHWLSPPVCAVDLVAVGCSSVFVYLPWRPPAHQAVPVLTQEDRGWQEGTIGAQVAEQLRQGLREVAQGEDMLLQHLVRGPVVGEVEVGQRLCEARGQRDLPQLPLHARPCSTALRRSLKPVAHDHEDARHGTTEHKTLK